MNKQEIHKAIQFAREQGFQKGKLEERERILNYINKLLNECKRNNPLSDYWAGKEIGLEQLQKEIGGIK